MGVLSSPLATPSSRTPMLSRAFPDKLTYSSQWRMGRWLEVWGEHGGAWRSHPAATPCFPISHLCALWCREASPGAQQQPSQMLPELSIHCCPWQRLSATHSNSSYSCSIATHMEERLDGMGYAAHGPSAQGPGMGPDSPPSPGPLAASTPGPWGDHHYNPSSPSERAGLLPSKDIICFPHHLFLSHSLPLSHRAPLHAWQPLLQAKPSPLATQKGHLWPSRTKGIVLILQSGHLHLDSMPHGRHSLSHHAPVYTAPRNGRPTSGGGKGSNALYSGVLRYSGGNNKRASGPADDTSVLATAWHGVDLMDHWPDPTLLS